MNSTVTASEELQSYVFRCFPLYSSVRKCPRVSLRGKQISFASIELEKTPLNYDSTFSTKTVPSRRVTRRNCAFAMSFVRTCAAYVSMISTPGIPRARDRVRAKYGAALAVDIFVSDARPLIFDKG